jgi:hypothetical protein
MVFCILVLTTSPLTRLLSRLRAGAPELAISVLEEVSLMSTVLALVVSVFRAPNDSIASHSIASHSIASHSIASHSTALSLEFLLPQDRQQAGALLFEVLEEARLLDRLASGLEPHLPDLRRDLLRLRAQLGGR